MVYIYSDSLNQGGPTIRNLNFGAKANSGSTILLNVANYNHGTIRDSSFQDGFDAIRLSGAADDSDWVVDGSYFRNNGTAIFCDSSATGGCNNAFTNNY